MKNKLPFLILLQIAIFLYFYLMGIIITNDANITNWTMNARVSYVLFSVFISLFACVGYVLNENTDEHE